MALHPFVANLIETLKGRPAMSDGTPAEARAVMAAGRAFYGTGPDMERVRDLEVPTRSGSIRARLLVPSGAPRGLVVHAHGGGWVIGSIDDFDAFGRTLAHESGCAVLLPEYRLAPEHRFPAALEDVEDTISWAVREMHDLLGARLPLVVAGDSAGGNLVAVAARRLAGRVGIALQALLYPVADCDFTTGSYRAHATGLPLTRRDMEWFLRQYADEALWTSPDISPLRAPALAGVAPAVVVAAQYDVLRDEAEAYAARLRAAGVAATFREARGLAHGFVRLHGHVDTAAAELRTLAGEIAAACDARA